ncbi:hypothetical protein C8J57DRAFT_1472589 [Mycena rebaudengoi]|nr:hypothetical protein C8J57DRAFT_1472589 [Mycena rebaudengoi]
MPWRPRFQWRRGKVKYRSPNSNRTPSKANTCSDLAWISLHALKDSADAFPPLKSAVGGVLALWEVTERAKHSRIEAHSIALRTKDIIDLIADAAPDGRIPPHMVQSIERFKFVLDEIRAKVEVITATGSFSRLVHLRDTERTIQDIQTRLEKEYRDFLAASALRVEVQQTTMMQSQEHIQADIGKVSMTSDQLLYYSRFAIFLARP